MLTGLSLGPLLLGGCGSINAARPLDAGEHQMGVTLGGPFVTSLGPPIPIPNLVVERRSGMEPLGELPWDVHYGVNSTSLVFGVIGLQGGANLHLMSAEGWRPSLSLTQRLHLYNNWLDWTKPSYARQLWAVNELDTTLGWALDEHLVYLGLGNVLELNDPELLLGPFLGAELRPGEGGLGVQLEGRLLGMNFTPTIEDVSFMRPESGGLWQATLSVLWEPGE